jgi:hypothetical protein
MYSQTDVIQMAVCVKLFESYKPKLSQDDAATLAAAVSNRLFGRQSPDHSQELLKQAENLAVQILRSDSEVRYGALMACRARLLVATDRGSEEKWKVWDTIQWMSTVCDLSPDEADPGSIRQLATTLHRKYLKKN